MSEACLEKSTETGLFGTENVRWQAKVCKISQVKWDQIEKGSDNQNETELWQAFTSKESCVLGGGKGIVFFKILLPFHASHNSLTWFSSSVIPQLSYIIYLS